MNKKLSIVVVALIACLAARGIASRCEHSWSTGGTTSETCKRKVCETSGTTMICTDVDGTRYKPTKTCDKCGKVESDGSWGPCT